MDEKKKIAIKEIVVYLVLQIVVIVSANWLSMAFMEIDTFWVYFIPIAITVLDIVCLFGILRVFKDTDRNLGFSKAKLWMQILHGVVLFVGMLLVFKLFGNSCAGQPMRFDIVLVFALWNAFSAAVTEELGFRGLVFTRFRTSTGNTIVAIVASSVLFGAAHFMVGNMAHIIMSAVTGVLLCTARAYLKNCTLVSTMTAHFLYDFLMCYIAI